MISIKSFKCDQLFYNSDLDDSKYVEYTGYDLMKFITKKIKESNEEISYIKDFEIYITKYNKALYLIFCNYRNLFAVEKVSEHGEVFINYRYSNNDDSNTIQFLLDEYKNHNDLPEYNFENNIKIFEQDLIDVYNLMYS